MIGRLLTVLMCLPVFAAAADQPGIVLPYESASGFEPANRIDELVLAELQRRKIQPANLCSDEVFVRRVYLDLIGTLPEASAVREFLEDQQSDKRAVLIDVLFERDEFADYWSLKWCDLLRVKAEFPINLWPNAVQAYHHWIRASIVENKPYDQFARELLTSSGSNFRVPPVNFYRALQGHTPSNIAATVGLTFMGTRLDGWPQQQRLGLEAFFSRIAYKQTAEWKEEIVYLDPAPADALAAVFPNGTKVLIQPGQDPRCVFAEWLISSRRGEIWPRAHKNGRARKREPSLHAPDRLFTEDHSSRLQTALEAAPSVAHLRPSGQ